MTYFNLIRISQWIKNFLIFVTPLTIGNFKVIFKIESVLFFVCFSLFVSSTYIINDIKDLSSDKLHPQKKNRPLASGKISINSAKIIFLIQFVISLFGIFAINSNLITFAFGYLVLTLLYSYKFKYIKYLDIYTIATLFVLRLYIGSYFFDIPVSLDLFIVILFLSILLVTSKKYSIRNNPEINSGQVKNFLLNRYTNKNLLSIYFISSVFSSIGLLYWIYDNKYQKMFNLDLLKYLFIFLLYVLLTFVLYRLTKKQKTEELAVLLYESKLLLSIIILIIFIYLFQFI